MSKESETHRSSRRRFIGTALGASAGAALTTGAVGLSAGTAQAAPGTRRTRAGGTRAGTSVAVFGAGVAGLTAAQELVERGFDVTVYERKELGGKSRSIPVAGTGTAGRSDLPGEHGFRFVPGFYRHLPQTMQRIPDGDGGSVHDRLVTLEGVRYSRSGGREDLTLVSQPTELPGVDDLIRMIRGYAEQFKALPADEALAFAHKMAIFATSGTKRRFGAWEKQTWHDFLEVDSKSEEFRKVFSDGMTTHLVASRPDICSTRATGILAELYFYSLAGLGTTGPLGRVLNAPTTESWITPWVSYLRERGVTFRVGWAVTDLSVKDGRIASARVEGPARRTETVEADHYVVAIPAERARTLWNADIRKADPQLAKMDGLRTEWMNGIQYYLDRPAPIIKGFVDYLDSPWALVSISQAQTWEARDMADDYGDGKVRDCLSVNIANWDVPGIVYGKPAKECTPAQIAEETLAQMRAALEDTGQTFLPESAVKSWHLDPAISYPNGGSTAANDEPLIVSETGSWDSRPEPSSAIGNLFLASDYVRDNLSCATMESANETAKRAVNALLEEAGSDADGCEVLDAYVPPGFDLLRKHDDTRYSLGLPHILDV